MPKAESRQWERGISMYYAKQYKRGAEQFELYQTYHDQDVENSVWRFLPWSGNGIKKTRAVMLPIENDRRIYVMKVFEMYRGTATPEEVTAAGMLDEGLTNKRWQAGCLCPSVFGLYY